VNKKKQKNFVKLGCAGFTATGPAEQTFFVPLFFKKAATFLFPLKPIMLSSPTEHAESHLRVFFVPV
jgi:hypothetical protein